MFSGFDPVFDKNSKVLIMGSFPSVKSREYGFYYGNKRNRFWTMLEYTFNEKIADEIEYKKQFLINHNIALYDVVKHSDLQGSSDDNLLKSNKQIASIGSLLPPYTKVEKIICNGKTAYKLLTKNCNINIPIVYMSSTSPANPYFDINSWKCELKSVLK